jgi:hypothetical protein
MQQEITKFALLLSLCCWVSGILHAAPAKGRFDLNRWDRSAALVLDGHWLYMPGRFVEPHEFEHILDHDFRDMQMVRPGVSLLDEENAPRFGTYILRLLDPQKLEELALFHGLYFSSAKSQVFCRHIPSRALTLSLGQVGASLTSSTPKFFTSALQDLRELAATGPCTELIIMLQVSSFHRHEAGLWLPPRLGRSSTFQNFMRQQERSSLFILTILLLVSLYAALSAWRATREKGARFIGLGAFLLTLRVACLWRASAGEAGSENWMWQLENAWIVSAAYLVPYLFLKSLMCARLDPQASRPGERFLDGLVLSLLLIQLLIPVRLWTAYTGVFHVLGLGCVLLAILALAQAAHCGTPNVKLPLVGSLFVFSSVLLELLALYRLVEHVPWTIPGYGMAIGIMLQLQMMTQRSADSLENSTVLSASTS